MNKTISWKLLCGAISAALLFFACGDESGMDAKNSPVASEVDTRFELGKCTEDQNGTTILVTTENAYYGCLNGMWTKQGDGTINPTNQDTPIQAISSSYLLLLSSSSTNTTTSSSDEKKSSSENSSSSVRDTYSSSSSSKMKAAWSYLNPNISYGEFTDSRDGQIYKTVKIGNQVWMAENLNYNIDSLKSLCYNNSVDSCFKYGRLYNWSAANSVCPQGWHLPTIDEWRTLISFAGDPEAAKLKLKSKSGWLVLAGIESVTGNGTDDFGFTVLPAGNYSGYENNFREVGVVTMFWSAGEYECNDKKICSYTLRINGGTQVYEQFGKIPDETILSEVWLNSIRCVEGPAPQIVSSSSIQSSSSNSWSYLNPDIDYGEFTDSRDGHTYKTVQIGNQVWMAENLNYDYDESITAASYCYNNSADSCAKYGRLYTWVAAMKACPDEWHLPTEKEWVSLIDYAKNDCGTNGICLQSASGWNGTDDYGFSILPAGWRREKNGLEVYSSASESSRFWTATENTPNYAKFVKSGLSVDSGRYYAMGYKNNAYSVRCIKGAKSVSNLREPVLYDYMTDSRDNQVYPVVTIGSQTWMAKNLDAWSMYRGEGYEQVEDGIFTLSSALNTCPNGWHLPSQAEWNTLIEYVGGDGIKLRDTYSWGAASGTDDYLFSAKYTEYPTNGYGAYFWSSTKSRSASLGNPGFYYALHVGKQVYVDEMGVDSQISVRCIKNTD